MQIILKVNNKCETCANYQELKFMFLRVSFSFPLWGEQRLTFGLPPRAVNGDLDSKEQRKNQQKQEHHLQIELELHSSCYQNALKNLCNCNIKLLIYFLVSCEEKIDAFMLDGMKSQVYSFSLSFHRFSAKTNKLKLWTELPPQLEKWVDPVFIVCHFLLGYSATSVFFSVYLHSRCVW